MRIFSLFTALALVSVVLSGPALAEPDTAARLAEARRGLEQVSARGFEWTTTGPLIDTAAAALAQGKTKDAERLLSAALEQIRQSLLQADYAQANWQQSIPR